MAGGVCECVWVVCVCVSGWNERVTVNGNLCAWQAADVFGKKELAD